MGRVGGGRRYKNDFGIVCLMGHAHQVRHVPICVACLHTNGMHFGMQIICLVAGLRTRVGGPGGETTGQGHLESVTPEPTVSARSAYHRRGGRADGRLP